MLPTPYGFARLTRFAPIFFVAALTAFFAGCKAPPAESGSPVPQGLSLTLRGDTVDGRHTYFELKSDGAFSYGGGRAGVLNNATPVSTLTAAQRQEIWNVITGYHLFEAKSFPFASSERVSFRVKLRRNGSTHEFRAIDDKVPGVQELHDLLFKYQAAVRYKVPGIN